MNIIIEKAWEERSPVLKETLSKTMQSAYRDHRDLLELTLKVLFPVYDKNLPDFEEIEETSLVQIGGFQQLFSIGGSIGTGAWSTQTPVLDAHSNVIIKRINKKQANFPDANQMEQYMSICRQLMENMAR
jgi:hypothetical protein